MHPIKVKHSGYVMLNKISNEKNGDLVVAEAGIDITFDFKRIYYINNFEKKSSMRGDHAHRELEQVIFAINGSFVLNLDDGTTKQKILMNNDNVGVRLGPMLWHTLEEFSSDCTILIFASDHYRENDYIRNYQDFLHQLPKDLTVE